MHKGLRQKRNQPTVKLSFKYVEAAQCIHADDHAVMCWGYHAVMDWEVPCRDHQGSVMSANSPIPSIALVVIAIFVW